MKLLTPLAVISLLLVASCSTDEPTSTQLTLQPSLFKEVDFSREYHYNSLNQLIQVKFISDLANGHQLESTQDFAYGANGKISETTSDTGFKFSYTYTGNRIVRTDEFINGSPTQHHTFTYNTKGLVTEYITWQNIPEEGGIIPVAKNTFEYDQRDNLTVQRMYYYTSFGAEAKLLTSFLSSDYDGKINTEDLFEVNVFNPYLTLRKNNPGKLIIQNGNGVVGSTEVYTYQYHPKGYVTSKTTNTTWYHGGTGTVNSTFQFRDTQ